MKSTNEYCIISNDNDVIHIGEIIEFDNGNYIRFKDYIKSEIITFGMNTPSVISIVNKKTHDLHIGVIDLVKKDPKITKKDFDIITRSREPHIKYMIIKFLRNFGFEQITELSDIEIWDLKKNIKVILDKNISIQNNIIKLDSDLSKEEKNTLINICNNAYKKYCDVINTSSSIFELLDKYPNILMIENLIPKEYIRTVLQK